MAGFSTARRQRIIDDYLRVTGKNAFRPGEFIDWLGGHPEHEAYDAFYAIDEAEAARAYRIELARRFVSGLRIVVTEHTTEDPADRALNIRHVEAPLYVSPMGARADGGGYVPYDPEDADSVASFRLEAATTLASWRRRYETTLTDKEVASVERLQKALGRDPVRA